MSKPVCSGCALLWDRDLANALALYDARRAMGTSEGRATYSTAAGFAAATGLTRDRARDYILAALKARSEIATRGPGPL